MLERVTLLPGDFLADSLPTDQDIILAFNVIHGLSDEQNRLLFERLLSALTTGGRLYVLDQLRPSGRRSSLEGFLPLMVGLNLLHEIGGGVYDRDDVIRWSGRARTVRKRRLWIPGVSLLEIVK